LDIANATAVSLRTTVVTVPFFFIFCSLDFRQKVKIYCFLYLEDMRKQLWHGNRGCCSRIEIDFLLRTSYFLSFILLLDLLFPSFHCIFTMFESRVSSLRISSVFNLLRRGGVWISGHHPAPSLSDFASSLPHSSTKHRCIAGHSFRIRTMQISRICQPIRVK
jgi:hypothetical protein